MFSIIIQVFSYYLVCVTVTLSLNSLVKIVDFDSAIVINVDFVVAECRSQEPREFWLVLFVEFSPDAFDKCVQHFVTVFDYDPNLIEIPDILYVNH